MNYRVVDLANGRQIGLAEYGDPDGAPLVALHGTPGSRLMMRPGHDAAKARGFRMIAPDRPGYGRSPARAGYTPMQWAEDMKLLLEGEGDFSLFAVSGGGPFALALAAASFERVRSIALASPVGLLLDEDVVRGFSPLERFRFQTLARRPLLVKAMFHLVRQVILKRPAFALRVLKSKVGARDRDVLANPLHADALFATFKDGITPGIAGAVDDLRIFTSPAVPPPWGVPLSKITMPLTIWHGSDDRHVPFASAQKLAERLPHCDFRALQGEGHFWIMDHFDQVLERLHSSSPCGARGGDLPAGR